MSDTNSVDTKVLAQQYREQAIPFKCPVCQKVYRSLAGILYHIGQFRGITKVPRCMLGEDTPKGSPARMPSSPMNSRKKTPKREALTWAESQRLVEVEFESDYHRIVIDDDLYLVDSMSDIENKGSNHETDKGDTHLPKSHTPNRRTRVSTPQSKGNRNKGKKKSKLKTPSQDSTANQKISLPEPNVVIIEGIECQDAPVRDSVYYRFIEQSVEEMDDMVEYDMDEEDYQWLALINEERKNEGLTSVPQEVFELLMDRLEKECVFESHVSGDSGEAVNPYNIDENAVCCICNDGECHNTNAILFCDMCNLAVHQECYGVPYIPEGQWLCRRCLQSPSRSVDCVLCPNKGGAFKQTVDSRWAHVICGLWIPEVQFSNPVFLEPIDGIQDVPSARWKLLCYICRKRCGACIQCAKANCYVAFHVTCAQQANLCMKIEIGKGGEVCKSAFCDSHTPPAARKKLMENIKSSESGGESEKEEQTEEVSLFSGDVEAEGMVGDGSAQKKGKGESKVVKRARKILEEQRVLQAPVVNLPYIPQHRLDRIVNCVSLHKKSQFIPKLVSYWKLKRQSRNGVPFLRRLQANSKGQKTTMSVNLSEEEREALFEQLSLWKALRHDLERARMLVELVRKREKLKREQLRLSEEISRLRFTPKEVIMKRLLNRLATKDPADIFAEPVSLEEVPDYLDIIKKPMDLGTMRHKVETHQYANIEAFEKDLQLIWNNAMIYNQKDTIYYRAAVRIKDAGKRMLEQAHKQIESALISRVTGMHDPDVEEPPPLTPNAAAHIQRQPLDMFTREGDFAEVTPIHPRERLNSTSLDEQVEYLEEQLSVLESQCKGSARKSREKQLRKELSALKRQIKLRDKANDPNAPTLTSPPRRKKAPTPPQDAEGLASQLLHGSLRLTVSRRAILSSSGIKLEERAKTIQTQKQEEDERGKDSPLLKSISAPAVMDIDDIEMREGNEEEEEEDGDEEEEVGEEEEEEEEEEGEEDEEEGEEDEEEGEEDEEEGEEDEERDEGGGEDEGEGEDEGGEEIEEEAVVVERKPVRTRSLLNSTSEKKTTTPSRVTWEEKSYVQQYKPRRRPRRRNRSYPMACERRKRDRRTRPRLMSETSNSEGEVGGPTSRTRSSTRHILGSSSSVANEGVESSGDDRIPHSPSSDVISDPQLEDNSSRQRIPSASSVEDLTVISSPLSLQRKRKHSLGSDSETPITKRKKQSLTKDVSKQLLKGLNGLSNGVTVPQPLDLVWAKCRGYPPYPALIIDPDMPSEGMRVNGEFIQAPSEEVLEHRVKNPQNTILVRFFDGRRTWQWLHPSKLDYLGRNKDFDHCQISASGASKRSVQQAYERAMRYLRKVIKSNNAEESDCSSSST